MPKHHHHEENVECQEEKCSEKKERQYRNKQFRHLTLSNEPVHTREELEKMMKQMKHENILLQDECTLSRQMVKDLRKAMHQKEEHIRSLESEFLKILEAQKIILQKTT